MEVRRAHCFFEQSGTFKNEFKKLGIEAYDYDIQDNFGETDHVVDLFGEIDAAYEGRASVFDDIGKEDIIMAFFPCIYFANAQLTFYAFDSYSNRNSPITDRIEYAMDRAEKRHRFHMWLYRLTHVVWKRGLRMVIENPVVGETWLTVHQNYPLPTIVDKDRSRRGDWFVKPTGYWFVNCETEKGFTWQQNRHVKLVNTCRGSGVAGVCSEERSMIHPDYARNFICDNVLGIAQKFAGGQMSLFGEEKETEK